jgi:DNA-binding transcriptional MocR family regulator
MLLMTVDKAGATPVYRQIIQKIVRLVDAGTLAQGDRLPPTRSLAESLGVHRSTVLRAYGELWALGYLESRPGSYSTVRRRTRPVMTHRSATATAAERPAGTPVINWDAVATPGVRNAHRQASRIAQTPPAKGDVIDFARLAADPDLTPFDDIRHSFKTVLVQQGRELLDYGDARGFLPLRETIARRMRAHGVTASAEEILVTNGAQQALDLTLRLLTRPGNAVALESPTYSMALSLFDLHGLALRGISMLPDGMDLDALAGTLKRNRPVLVYTVPNFQNPTGVTTGQAHRERLLSLCEEHRVPLVEDGFEEEMKYFGNAVLPIKSMDLRGVVIYLGTFSKVVFPGLRIGWIAAPRECVDRLYAIQRASSLSGNNVAQAAAARFCGSGLYEMHLRRVHKVYRKRMHAMLQGLRERMPGGVEWTQPEGGYTLWLRLRKTREGEDAILARLNREGVRVAPGSLFFPRARVEPHFRLSIACVSEEQIVEGCRRLGRALAAAGA